MNNKLAISVLVILVVIIWGTVAYRLKSYTPLKSETLTMPVSLVMDTIQYVEKSYTLQGDYPDPFLGKREKKIDSIREIAKAKKVIIWPDLLYKGCVVGKSKLAIVKKNNQTIFLRQGEFIDDVALDRIEEDFIVLMKQRKRNIIRKSKLSEEIP